MSADTVYPQRSVHPGWRLTALILLFSSGIFLQRQEAFAQDTAQTDLANTAQTDLAGSALRHLEAGRDHDAEVVADSLLQLDPESRVGWELLGTSRYLQDNLHGALRAWARIGKPQVARIEVDFLLRGGEKASPEREMGFDRTGIRSGELLTVSKLVQGERRLRALPATSEARLEYRMLAGGEALLSGVVRLNGVYPSTRGEIAGHTLRLLVGRIQLTSAHGLGHLEAWELAARVSERRYWVSLSLAHPAPQIQGVWRWTIDHEEGSWATATHPTGTRVVRTGLEWRHTDWISERIRGSVLGRVDRRTENGSSPGAGLAMTFLSLSERSEVTLAGTVWPEIGPGKAFGQISLLTTRFPEPRSTPGGPSGLAARIGILALSAGAPIDLAPLFGAGGHADIAMRAHREIDRHGVALALLPGTAWIHGGIELLQSLGAIGPVGMGVALFVDGAGAIGGQPAPDGQASRRTALNLGAGGRARLTGVPGWLRIDWGVNPADGTSSLSAGWVLGASS